MEGVHRVSDVYKLEGKKAIVTGASKGIGAAIADALARQGSEVLLIARDINALDKVASEINANKGVAKVYGMDISDHRQIEHFFESGAGGFGKADIFVNNAGFTVYKSFTQTSLAEFDSLVATNVRGALLMIQKVAENMIERCNGVITFVTSINALNPLFSQCVYSSTKAMLESIMKSMAVELAPHGIRVNSVVPGAILTDMNPHFDNDENVRATESCIPAGRIGVSEEIADVVAFVCSDAARYMYGSSIVVDGGMLLKR